MTLRPNPDIGALAPYALADLSVPDGRTLISLAQNELCFSPAGEVLEAASRAMSDAQRYPDPDWTTLTHAIADAHELDPGRILCGAGSMELLEVLGRAYLSAGDQVIMSQFGYSFFRTVAGMYGAEVSTAPEHDFTVNVDELLSQVRPQTKMMFVANPGNPTGTLLPAPEVRRLRASLDDRILLILDEAYADFADNTLYPPLFDLVDRNDTVVLRTFSKIHGLAGMRVGWGYFPEDIRNTLRKILNPNNISLVSQAAPACSVSQPGVMVQRRRDIRRIREAFREGLSDLGLPSPESQANFVLIDFATAQKAAAAFEGLRNQGILLRPMSAYGLPHCLRATLSIESHMDLTLRHLADLTT